MKHIKHQLLVEAYDETALSEIHCCEWIQKFRNSEFDDMDYETLLGKILCHVQKELTLESQAISIA